MLEGRTHAAGDIVLETVGLTKIFGGLIAVNSIDLKVHKGEILSLIGPNGAGKTTVLNVVKGIYRPEFGQVFLRGERITGKKPHPDRFIRHCEDLFRTSACSPT